MAVPASVSISAGGFSHRIRVGVVSDTGTVRKHNEDRFYVPGLPFVSRGEPGSSVSAPRPSDFERRSDNGSSSSELKTEGGPTPAPLAPEVPGLFVVADGMGGQLAGEKASEMAVELIPRQFVRTLATVEDERDLRRAIRDSVAYANQEILSQSQVVTEFSNMGTTVVLVLFRGDRAYVAGIGDSRAYRLRDGKLERLTTDHSLAEALVGAGTIRPEEAENHKFRHVLYNYLGCKDARDGPEEIRVLDARPGDRFLLASDGLTGVVRDATIAEVLGSTDNPQRAAQALLNRALENRSKDNITCLVIEIA
jgi:protein phosphatase